MTSKTIAFFAFLILLTIPASQAVAQNPISTQNNTGDANPVKIIEKTRLEGIDRANRMMRLGDYEGAAAILETIFEKDPQNIEVKNLLATCYERSKDYSKMLLFLKSRLATEPPGYPLYRAVGRTYVLMGFPDSAQSFFYAAVSRAPGNDRAFSTIAEIYHKFGHYRFESEFIDSARVLTGNPTLLADRMGDALAIRNGNPGIPDIYGEGHADSPDRYRKAGSDDAVSRIDRYRHGDPFGTDQNSERKQTTVQYLRAVANGPEPFRRSI